MLENKVIRGIHASRFIASWAVSGGTLLGHTYKRTIEGGVYDFKDWLQSLEINSSKLSDEEVYYILDMARNGKLEFQESAKLFIKNNTKEK